ncbi:YheC/YheD family protein [Paenisporosarcina antarctica]|uniref:YheC/YheD family protein n=1 Tax=Paenisporosarcina antarctica TaxID=417367 RepID=UPI001FBAD251|nr:YheC/YheD family protein [Paenisporosarcina antarctica]
MYKWLSTNSNLSKHLPITRLVNSLQDIIGFLGKYIEGIIKPINGSYGEDIFKVSKQAVNFKVDTSLYQKEKKIHYI